MARGMNWEKAAMRDKIGRPRPTQGAKKRKKPKGITNKQAKYLAALQRRLGEPYRGNGITAAQASAWIADCERRLDAQANARTHPKANDAPSTA